MKFKNWTTDEMAIVRKYYPQEGGLKIQARLPGKSLNSIYAYANYAHISYIRTGKPGHKINSVKPEPYTQHEIDQIKDHYPKEGPDMSVRIPPRTRSGVKAKARTIGVRSNRQKRWTQEEHDLAVSLVREFGLNEAAKRLGRSYSSLSCYMCRHDCPGRKEKEKVVAQPKKGGKWRSSEEDILRTYYPAEGAECYKRLELRTAVAVSCHANKMGLHYYKSNRYWTSDEEAVLRFCMENKKGTAFCANLLGRTKCAVTQHWARIKKEAHANEQVICA